MQIEFEFLRAIVIVMAATSVGRATALLKDETTK